MLRSAVTIDDSCSPVLFILNRYYPFRDAWNRQAITPLSRPRGCRYTAAIGEKHSQIMHARPQVGRNVCGAVQTTVHDPLRVIFLPPALMVIRLETCSDQRSPSFNPRLRVSHADRGLSFCENGIWGGTWGGTCGVICNSLSLSSTAVTTALAASSVSAAPAASTAALPAPVSLRPLRHLLHPPCRPIHGLGEHAHVGHGKPV